MTIYSAQAGIYGKSSTTQCAYKLFLADAYYMNSEYPKVDLHFLKRSYSPCYISYSRALRVKISIKLSLLEELQKEGVREQIPLQQNNSSYCSPKPKIILNINQFCADKDIPSTDL